MRYPFFLSYSRNDDNPENPDPVVQEFVDELNKRVRYYTGSREGAFRDRNEIVTGQLWKDRLSEGLQESATLVCLYSPSYFASAYCGKEMEIFLNRRRTYISKFAGKKPANIIPILWHSTKRIPKTLPDFEYRTATLDKSKFGVWNLGDRKRFDQQKAAEFYDIIDDIAIRIRDAAADTPLPKLAEIPPFDSVASAFDPPEMPLLEFDSVDAAAGPDAVTFVYATPPAWDAWPYVSAKEESAKEEAVLRISSMIAKGKEFEPHQLVFEPERADLLDRLDRARERNNVVMVFVEAGSISQPAFRAQLAEYDKRGYDTFSTVVIWNNNRTNELEQQIKDTLPFFSSRRPPFFHLSVGDPGQFENAITSSLELLRSEVLKKPRLTNPIPKSAAFSTRPGLSGPGSTMTTA